jgi:hypothetical protein
MVGFMRIYFCFLIVAWNTQIFIFGWCENILLGISFKYFLMIRFGFGNPLPYSVGLWRNPSLHLGGGQLFGMKLPTLPTDSHRRILI